MAKQALLSVYEKTGLEELARALIELGYDLVSSDGTAKRIREAGLEVREVTDLTGFPEGLGGRVKTLHPKVHAGILADLYKPEHRKFLKDNGVDEFDIVVCNLYPFTSDPSIELIDIGGPTMVRAAAKNHAHVAVLTDPSQYGEVIEELQQVGDLNDDTRKRLSDAAFAHTAKYELPIAIWANGGDIDGFIGDKMRDLTYGENPDQSAALFTFGEDRLTATSFELVPDTGRIPGYVNITDIDRLLATMRHIVAGQHASFAGLEGLCVAIAAKHGNPCGVGVAMNPEDAIKDMVVGDKQAILGAAVMTNFPINGELATLMRNHEVEPGDDGKKRPRIFDGVCAPSFDDEAIAAINRMDDKFFLAHDPRLEELDINAMASAGSVQFRSIDGGFMVQSTRSAPIDLKTATVHGESLNEELEIDVAAGIAIAGTSNSNTICLMSGGRLIGLGAGQQKRNAACDLALLKAVEGKHETLGSVAVSDGFFPYAIGDGPEALLKAGVKVIVSPGGGRVGDPQMLELVEKYGFTWVQLPNESRMFSNH